MIDFPLNKTENNNSNNSMNNNGNKNENIFSIYDKFMELKEENKDIMGRAMKRNSISNKGCVSLSCKKSIKETGSGSYSYLEDSPKSGLIIGIRKKLLSMGKKDHYEERDNIILFENFDGLIEKIKLII